MASPTSIENFHKPIRSPLVGSKLPELKNACEKCRKSSICALLKECSQCNQFCPNESDNNQVLGSLNPSLSNRFAESQNEDTVPVGFLFAKFSDGAEKEIICRILNIKDTKDIDTVSIYITTKSNKPPVTDRPTDATETHTSPALKPRFSDDSDYEAIEPLSPNIIPSKSRQNPDIIEGPPPKLAAENSLIVEPEGLDDSDDDSDVTPADSKAPTEKTEKSLTPKLSQRSGSSNLPDLLNLKEMSRRQEQHLADLNNALREAKEMIKSIQDQQPTTLGSGKNAVGAANNDFGSNVLDLKETAPKMVENLKKMNEFFLDRAQDALGMINSPQKDVVGNSKVPQQTPPSNQDPIEAGSSFDNTQVNDQVVSKTLEPIPTGKPNKEIFKAKLQKYIDNIKKNKSAKIIAEKSVDKERTIPNVANRHNADSTKPQAQDSIISLRPSLDPKMKNQGNFQEKLKKDTDILKQKLNKFMEEQKRKSVEKVATKTANQDWEKIKPNKGTEYTFILDENRPGKTLEPSTENDSPEPLKESLKEKLNKFVNRLQSSPIKNDLEILSATKNNEKVSEPDIEESMNLDKEIIPKNNLNIAKGKNSMMPEIEKIREHTDKLKEKLRMFAEKNNDKLKESLPNQVNKISSINMPNEKSQLWDRNTENNKVLSSSNIGTHKSESEPSNIVGTTDDSGTQKDSTNILESRNSQLENALSMKKLKQSTDNILEKLRAANDGLIKTFQPKSFALPKLKPALPIKKIELFPPQQKLDNEEKRAKLRAKIQEYVNSFHKAPKLTSPGNVADKFGKGLLTTLKSSADNDLAANELGSQITVNNRMKEGDNNLQSETPTNLAERKVSSKSCPVELDNRGNFNKNESSRWPSTLGKIVKSPENDLFFIGDGIKLPLRMATKTDGTIDLSVDLDRLCSCNSCPKNPAEIEDTVGAIMEKEAELQKEINSNNSAELKTSLNTNNIKKRKRSASINEEVTSNSVKKENNTVEKNFLHDNTKFGTHEVENKMKKNKMNNDLKTKLDKNREMLQQTYRKLNKNIEEHFQDIFEIKPDTDSFINNLEENANDVKEVLDKDKTFIKKLNNKLSNDNKKLKSKVHNILNDAQESVIEPHYILEKKLENLNNEIKKENEKHEDLLAKESKMFVGDKDINEAVKQEINIIENIHNWFKRLSLENSLF